MSADTEDAWQTATWQGVERAEIRRSLKLSVRERLEGAEQLAEVSRKFAQLRAEGRISTLQSSQGQVSESLCLNATPTPESSHAVVANPGR